MSETWSHGAPTGTPLRTGGAIPPRGNLRRRNPSADAEAPPDEPEAPRSLRGRVGWGGLGGSLRDPGGSSLLRPILLTPDPSSAAGWKILSDSSQFLTGASRSQPCSAEYLPAARMRSRASGHRILTRRPRYSSS